MGKNLCPFDIERRPCMEHDCALYLQLEYQNAQGESRSDWLCTFTAQAKLQLNAVVETARVQASLDKTATEVRDAGRLVGTVMLNVAAKRALTNGEGR